MHKAYSPFLLRNFGGTEDTESSNNFWVFFLSSQVIDYANALVEFFNVGPKRSNVGIITYGTEAELAMDFNTFQGDNLSPENVQDLIDNLVPQGGDRFIDKALILANERLFTKEAGMRVNDNDTLKVCDCNNIII